MQVNASGGICGTRLWDGMRLGDEECQSEITRRHQETQIVTKLGRGAPTRPLLT